MKQTRPQFNGDALRNIRRNFIPNAHGRRLTQKELTELAGFKSRNVVGEAERSHRCSKAAGEAFARALGIPVDDLYKHGPLNDSVRLSAQEKEVIEAMRLSRDISRDIRTCAMAFRLAHLRDAPPAEAP